MTFLKRIWKKGNHIKRKTNISVTGGAKNGDETLLDLTVLFENELFSFRTLAVDNYYTPTFSINTYHHWCTVSININIK